MTYGYVLEECGMEKKLLFLAYKLNKTISSKNDGSPIKDLFLSTLYRFSEQDEVVTYIDQIATSINDLIEIYENMAERKIKLTLIGVDREQGENIMLFQLLKLVKSTETDCRKKAVLAGKQKALEQGKKEGRPFTRSQDDIDKAVELLESKSYHEVEEITGIPYGTLRYYKRKAKEEEKKGDR